MCYQGSISTLYQDGFKFLHTFALVHIILTKYTEELSCEDETFFLVDTHSTSMYSYSICTVHFTHPCTHLTTSILPFKIKYLVSLFTIKLSTSKQDSIQLIGLS